jgi:hypothetical protein
MAVQQTTLGIYVVHCLKLYEVAPKAAAIDHGARETAG